MPEEQKEILCNRCGKSLYKLIYEDVMEVYGLPNISFSTGYASAALPDGEEYTFSLCEECLSDMFCDFKIPPKEKDLMFGSHWYEEEDEV